MPIGELLAVSANRVAGVYRLALHCLDPHFFQWLVPGSSSRGTNTYQKAGKTLCLGNGR
jgi:hypothetical protein